MICLFCKKPAAIDDITVDDIKAILDKGGVLPKYTVHTRCNRVTWVRGMSSPFRGGEPDDSNWNAMYVLGSHLYMGGYRERLR